MTTSEAQVSRALSRRTGSTASSAKAGRGAWWLRDGVRPLLLATDVTAAAIALAVGGARTGTGLFCVLVLALYAAGHLYRSRLSLSLLDDLPRLFGRWLGALALLVLTQAAFNRVRWGDEVVDWAALEVAIALLIGVLALRAGAYSAVRGLRRRQRVVHPTLILGAGQIGTQIAHTLADHPEYGLNPVGYLDNDPLLPRDADPLPVLGPIADLALVLREHDVRTVVVAFAGQRESTMVEVIRTCDRLRCEIFLVPRLFEVHSVAARRTRSGACRCYACAGPHTAAGDGTSSGQSTSSLPQ